MSAPPASGERARRRRFAPRPAGALVGLALLLAAGVGLAPRLLPDRHGPPPLPALAIEAELPGLAAEVVEHSLTLPFERAVTMVPGLQEVVARTLPGRAELLLGFASSAARDAALPALRAPLGDIARAAGARRAPDIASVDRASVAAAIYAVRAPAGSDDVVHWVQTTLADALRALPSVTQVTIAGTQQREILVQPDMERLATLGLGFDALITGLRQPPATAQSRVSAPASVEALAAASVQLPSGEPIALAELARIAVIARAPGPPGPTEDAPVRLIVRAPAVRAAEVAERVHAHLAWLEANDLVSAQLTLSALHDEAQALRAWRGRVLARVAVCVAVVLAFLAMVFGLRRAGLIALGFGVWLPATLAALWLLGFTLNLPVVAGLLIATAPFVLLMVLPSAGVSYVAGLAGAASLWTADRVLGAPFAGAAAALAVAVVIAGPVRWLLIPWLRPPRPLGPVSRLGTAATRVPTRVAALVVAAFVLAAVAVSIYALPGVQVDATEGGFRLRLVGEDPRRVRLTAGWLTAGLHAVPRVVDVESTAAAVERWRLRLDPARVRAHEITPAAVGRAFAIAHEGLVVGAIVDDGARVPVRLQLAPGAAGPAFERLLLRGARAGEPALYLRDVGAAERAREPRARLRVNGNPAAELRARWVGREARAALRRYCRRLDLPKDYEVECRVSDLPSAVR